ncbi:TatD family hydrolase [Cellulomonas triticagri]|uniref:TatD family deoxyribonuclease n=1 Tax=Cellulomonas triticagri TaxID=2483352 RepID=A0A3M2JP38_9CELL|nr:TatD family hydrolase [Cellulomonas triticagri]RMI12445.1 TatD family deoxyribonuclease [Cellulomonas triticagri]
MARRNRPRGWAPSPEPLPAPVVDDHTHLESVLGVTAEAGSDADGEPAPVTLDDHLDRAAAVGVPRLVQVGCDLDAVGWTDAVLRLDAGAPARPAGAAVAGSGGGLPVPAFRGGRRALLGAVAIHPNEAVLHAGVHEVAPDGLDPDPQPRHDLSLDDALARVAEVARGNDRVRAIGETGLDFFRAGPRGRAVQREAFRAHVALAKELGLALQIHDRDAHDDVVDVLLRDGAPERTVFHCFSGGPALAEVCAREGWFASIAGPVGYPANEDLRAAVRLLPADLLLVETDAPYLTPAPHRGRPHAPYLLPHTVRAVADARGTDLATLCRTLSTTTERVYGPW